MAKRYENAKIKKKLVVRGKKISQSYIIESTTSMVYSTIPKTNSDIYVITQAGDRLDHLANQYYGDVNLWWYIAKANNLKFMTIPTGTSLRIPATTEYATGR